MAVTASQEPKTRLVTGFEPFLVAGERVDNPTIPLVDALQDRATHTAILPVEYERTAATFDTLLRAHTPHEWIGFGLAAHRTWVELEVVALNIRYSEGRDNAGATANGAPVIDNAPLAYRSAWPVEQWALDLRRAGHFVRASFSAGTFLCNQVYFQACHHVAGKDTRLEFALFVHIPAPENLALRATMSAVHGLLDRIDNHQSAEVLAS